MVFLVLGAVVLIASASTMVNAQSWYPQDTPTQKWANNPCADARISWVLWVETASINRPQGGTDCDPANYDFSKVHKGSDMNNQLLAYRDWQRAHLRLSPVATSANRQRYQMITDLQSGATVVVLVGQILGNSSSGVISNASSTFKASDGASISAISARDLPRDVAGVVAQGAGNVVSQGAGNFRGVFAVGEKVVQLRGRWYKVR
jgi:hypothetical protein